MEEKIIKEIEEKVSSLEEKILLLERRISLLEEKEGEKLLSVKETANLLKVSPSIIYTAIRNGTIQAIDCFGVLKIKKKDVIENLLKIKKYRHSDLDLQKIESI